MHSSDEKTIDLKDFLVELLFRWKFILLFTLILAILAGAFGAFRAMGQSGAEIGGEELTEEELKEKENELLETARNAITDVEAEEVERVYNQYSSYINYRNMIQAEFSSYDKAFDKSGEEMLLKRTSYRLDSSLEGAENQFTTFALDISDYKKIVTILPDTNSLAAAYKHVYFGSMASNTTELTNMGEEKTVIPTEYMITSEVIGNNVEVCDQIAVIIEEAFQKKLKELRKLDPDAKLVQIGTNYRGNIYEYFINKKQTTFDTIQKVDTTINNLKTYGIDKLSEEQKAYFSALRDSERALIDSGVIGISDLSEEEPAAPTGLVNKKLIALGILAGLFLSFVIVLVQYLFSGTINVGQEMQDYYRIPVLNTFFVKGGRGMGLFPPLIRRLLHVDSTEAETKAAMIAADTCGAVERAEGDSVYFIQTCRNMEDMKVASMLEKAVAAQNAGCKAATGAPLDSVRELNALTQHKNAVILIHNKKTVQADVEKILDLCSRHSIRVLGAVTITDM